VLEGYGQVLGVPLEREAFGFNPNVKWWSYAPERAKALLREAGYANGFEMTLHAPNRRHMNDIEVMQAIAAIPGKVGIKAKVQVWEQSIYTTKWRKRELLPAYMTAWGGAGVFDGDLLVNSLHSKSALAIHSNEALDKILEEAQGTNDPERRKALYFRAQELIFEDAPIIKAYQQAHIFGISHRLDWTPWIDNMLYARLFSQGVTLIPMTVAVAIVPGGVRTRHTFSGAEAVLDADTVVLAFGGKANDALFPQLDGKVPELKVIGDAYSPRRIHDAILDGARAARAL
jgi:peptide/nickel transport system substrate-binding protein